MTSRTVRAGVVTQPGKAEVQEFAFPTELGGGGLLKVEAAALAGIDYEWFSDINVDSYDAVSDFRFPFIPGHIVVGHIAEVDADAAAAWEVAVGDRVIVQYDVSCYRCATCRVGEFERCLNLAGYGLWFDFTQPPHLWGGAAEYMVLHPMSRLAKVSDERSAAELCMLERLSDATNWVVDSGELKPGETLVVFGTGALGQAAVMVGRLAGAGQIIVVGRAESTRLGALKDIGADVVVSGPPEEVIARVRDLTGGAGAPVVIDVSSATAYDVPATAIKVAANRGRIVQVAVKQPPQLAGIDSAALVTNQLTYRGVLGHRPRHLHRAVSLDAGTNRPPLEKARFSLYSLDQIQEAMETSPSTDGSVLAIITP